MKADKAPNNKGPIAGPLWTAGHYVIRLTQCTPVFVRQMLSSARKLQGTPKKTGRVAIVTGGARGIGASVVQQLLETDMHVIIACRNIAAADQMIAEFRKSTGITSGTPHPMVLDLSSFQSVRSFVASFLSLGLPLDVLINNAVAVGPYAKTRDALIESGNSGTFSRIINVSSFVTAFANIKFEDIPEGKFYDRYVTYFNTKLMQCVFTNYMNRRFVDGNIPIRVFAVNPGFVATDFFKRFHFGWAMKILVKCMGKSQDKGAYPIVWAALQPKLEPYGGRYISNCKFIKINRQMEDLEIQGKLWHVSCKLTQLNENSALPIIRKQDKQEASLLDMEGQD